MKALYAFVMICMSAPALAGSIGSPVAAADPAAIWHEFDYDTRNGVKVAKVYPSNTELLIDLAQEIHLAETWHEFDYDLKNGIKVAKAYPSSIELLVDLAQEMQYAEVWHEFDYDLRNGIKVAKAYPAGQEFDLEMTASIPAAK